MRNIWVAIALFTGLGAASSWAQPPEGALTPVTVGQVCLTNACDDVAAAAPATPRTVSEAISAGNVSAVRALGGTADQGLEAMKVRNQKKIDDTKTPQERESRIIVAGNFAMFADGSQGATFSWSDDVNMIAPPGAGEIVGSILRSEPGGGGRRIWLTSDGGVVGIVQPTQIAPPIGLNPLPPGFRPTPVP